MILPQLILTVFLGIAAWTDIRKREIPIWIAIPTILIVLLIHSLQGERMGNYLIAFGVLGFLYFLGALFITGSGGDIFLMAAVGAAWGISGSLIIVLLSSGFIIIYALLHKLIKNGSFLSISYPLAPFTLISHSILLFICLFETLQKGGIL